jgi:hypothetical protein
MYYRVMYGQECFGNGSKEQCDAIVRMHKSKIGGKEHKGMSIDWQIVPVEGKYPPDEKDCPKIVLSYKAG